MILTLSNLRGMIPKAKKHDSWDEDEDGIWKAPKVPNPAYKGPWKCMTDREQRILIVRENGRLLGLIIQVFLSMGGPAVAGFERTFVLQLIDACPCNSCAKKVQKHLKQIHGIGSILTDAAEGKVTISGSMVDPYTVITELEKLKKKATLFSEEIPIENMVEEKQTVLRKSEVLEGQSEVVLCKPADNNQSEVDPHTVITELEKLKKKATLFSEEIPIENMVDEKQIVLRKSEVLEGQSEVVLCKPADNNQVVDEFASSLSPDIQSKHEHKLELKNFDKRFTCNGCKEEGFRSRYRCEQCDYDLHHNCMFPKPTVSHELFRGSIFEFSNKRPIPTCGDRDCRAQVHMISCDACGNEIHGYFYHCKAKNLSLHPCCINLKSKLCVQGSTFSLKNKASSKCFWCNVKSEKGVNSGWSYVSECENYQFHVKCIVQMAHEAWKKKMDEDVDVYSVVLAESLNMRLVRKSKRNGWSRGAKFVEMIILIARTIIGILFGDPTAILAPIVVELLKN